MKPLTAIAGVVLGICLVSPSARNDILDNLHLSVASAVAAPVAQAAPATTTTAAAPPLAPTQKSDGMYVRGVKMPANCHADQFPELVAYVTQHTEVPASDIADYVCGWN